MKKIMITGSSGNIGKDISPLLEKKYRVVKLTSSTPLSDDLFKDVIAIIHLAGKTPHKEYSLTDYIDSNVLYTQKILNFALANNVDKVLVTTSWSWLFKLGDYQYSKLLQEKVVNIFEKKGLVACVLELPDVQTSSFNIVKFLGEKAKKEELTVDELQVSSISSQDIASVCEVFIEEGSQSAKKKFDEVVFTYNLYEEVAKIAAVKKGIKKSRTPLYKGDSIEFPFYEQ